MSDTAARDQNRQPSTLLESNANDHAQVAWWADPVTHRGLVSSTITSISALTTPLSAKTTVTVAGTRVQLAANACKVVTLKALATNSGLIYVGDATVSSTNGFQLSVRETVSFEIDNTNRIYIDSS